MVGVGMGGTSFFMTMFIGYYSVVIKVYKLGNLIKKELIWLIFGGIRVVGFTEAWQLAESLKAKAVD